MDNIDRRKCLQLIGAGSAGAMTWGFAGGKLTPREYKNAPVMITNVRLVDPENERTDDRPSDIKLDRGRISAIAPVGNLDSKGHKIIDGANGFILPGLIDCHIHICGIFITELPGVADLGWIFKQISLNHRAELQSGVTLCRDMMSALQATLLYREKAEDPLSGYPRVLCAGPMFTVPGGYPPYVPRIKAWQKALVGSLKLEVKDKNDAINWVDRLADSGVDCIKIGYQSALFDVARTPMNNIPDEWFTAICDRAHHHGLPVGVHHYWIKDFDRLLDLPFDTLEHITEDAALDSRMLDRIAERGLPVTTDLEQSTFAYEPEKFMQRIEDGASHLMPRPQREIGRLLEDVAADRDVYGLMPRQKLMELAFIKDLVFQKMKNAKALADHGIVLGSATDSGVHMMIGILPDELIRLTASGLTNAHALRTATSDAAKLLRIDDVGRIRQGNRGDFVIYGEDPLANIKTIKNPRLVIRDGVPQIF